MGKIDKTCIIDDDHIYIYSMKRLLSLHHLCDDILIFNNGEEAIEHLADGNSNEEVIPDVILLDINMPVMNGWEFLENFIQIKSRIKKNIDVYVISSSVDKEDIVRAKSYKEVKDYFIKPLTLNTLQKIFRTPESFAFEPVPVLQH